MAKDAWYKVLWTEAICYQCSWRARGWRTAWRARGHAREELRHEVEMLLRVGSPDLAFVVHFEEVGRG